MGIQNIWAYPAVMATALAGTVAAGIATAADPTAQYPGDYYGRIDLPLTQALAHVERLMDDTDNFEPLSQFSPKNRYRIMASPIGRLDLLVRTGGEQYTSLCTGWVISQEYILTNNHCIPGKKGQVLKASLVMNYLEEGDTSSVERFEVETQPVETSPELDYSIVRIHGNPAAKYGFIPLQARDAEPGEELFIIQHPAGKPKRLTRRNCRADEDRERPEELRHFCDTLGGSSGSPVFSDNDMSVVGLHFAGIERKVNFAKRMTMIVQQSSILQQLSEASKSAGRPERVAPATVAPAAPAPAGTSPGGWQSITQ